MADDEEHLLLHAVRSPPAFSLPAEAVLTSSHVAQERSSIFETRVERAALCRDRGSARFRLKDLAGAVGWYERALFHVDFDEGTWMFEVRYV